MVRRSSEEWIVLIRECRSSGLCKSTWCRDHGINKSTYLSAEKRFDQTKESSETKLVPQVVEIKLEEANSTVNDTGRSADTAARIVSQDMMIEITNTASSEAIYGILSSLRRI